MKKLIVFLLVVALSLGTTINAFAISKSNEQPLNTVQNDSQFLNVNGQLLLTNVITEDGQTSCVETIGKDNDAVFIKDNEAIAGGQVVATMSVPEKPQNIVEPNFMQVITDTPGYGTDSDYTYDFGVSYSSMQLPNTLINCTVGIIASVIVGFIGITGTANIVASAILSSLPTLFQGSSLVYCARHTYGHYLLPTFYQKRVDDWYYDSSYQWWVPGATEVTYMSRA